MNRNDPNLPWARLTAAARQTRDERDTSVPFGFATRVAALGLAQPQGPGMVALLERFSFRAVGVACLLAVLSVVTNYSLLQPTQLDDELASDEAAALLLDLSTD